MVRGTLASIALAAATGGLSALAFAGPDAWKPATVLAQAAPEPGKPTEPAQPQPAPTPAPAQGQTPPQAAPQVQTPPSPEPAPGQPAQPAPTQEQPSAPETPKEPGVTELPPVKVTPAPAETPKPKPKPKPRVTEEPRREAPPVVETPVRPPRRIVTRPAPAPAPAPARPSPVRAAPARPAPSRPAPAQGAPAPGRAEAAAPQEQPPPSEAATPSETEQGVPLTPVKGSEIPLEKVPSAVAQVTSGEIERSGSPAIEQAIQQNVPGAIISDVNGNPFAADIQYRGFTASPVEGTPQGLAVYQNGVRINEVFGDTLNWDLIPSTAINSITVVSGNPLYGLNALGGALNITMKDGFGFQGVESDTRAGSYGRFQEFLQLGKQVDNFAAYAAVEGIWDDGWRYFSPSEVRRAYFDLGVKDKDTELHINFTGAENALGVVGPTPVQLLAEDYSAVYTNPQTTVNQLAMLSANGTTKLTDAWSSIGRCLLAQLSSAACRRQRIRGRTLHGAER